MPTINGEFQEATNSTRADWASTALDAYAAETRNDPREQTVELLGPDDREGKENAEEVMSDLLCDLHHLADRFGIEWEALLGRGAMHYRDEVAEARK